MNYHIAIVHRIRATRFFHALGFADITHMESSVTAAQAPAWPKSGAATQARDLRQRFAGLGYRFVLVPSAA